MVERAVDEAQAHLLVHAGDRARRHDPAPLIERLQRGWRRPSPTHDAPISLCIEDLAGHRVLDIARLDDCVDIALPPGTYHLTARRGGAARRYTMTLAAAGLHELHLRMPVP